MKRRVAFPLTVVAAALLSVGAANSETRGVVELFTSQGCSSCPAADKLAGELAKDPSLVVLSLSVDYWDYLGWKDTLALPGHTSRQRAYSRARGDREVYTPQVVVNGTAHVLGSDKAAIENAITQTHNRPGTLSLPVTVSVSGGQVAVTLPAAKGPLAKGEVWLCPVTREVPVEIRRGENSGQSLTYHNVVRRWIKVGDWNGAARTWTVPMQDVTGEGIDSLAVVVQSGTRDQPGAMIGAAVASLH